MIYYPILTTICTCMWSAWEKWYWFVWFTNKLYYYYLHCRCKAEKKSKYMHCTDLDCHSF